MIWKVVVVFTLLQLAFRLAVGIRLTHTEIPEYAILYKAAILECQFVLENDSLYAVKWYKDNHEFFRYKPTDNPPISTFPVVGISVNVNESSLNTVQLEPITLSSRGIYKCEVSADAPSFQTVYEDQLMKILALPEKGPIISGVHPWYNLGDMFSAKCHVHRSIPSVHMVWFLNDEEMDPEDCNCISTETFEAGKAIDGTNFYSSTSHVKLSADTNYFRDGTIILECRAAYSKTNIVLKDTVQSNIKSGLGFRRYADTLSGSAFQKLEGNPWMLILVFAANMLIICLM